MSEHKQANVVASTKSGMVVGGGSHRAMRVGLVGWVGIGLFVALVLGLLAIYMAHRSDTSPGHQARAAVKSLQSQIKKQSGDDGSKIGLYQQLAVACAQAKDTKCADDASNKVVQIEGSQTPSTYIVLAQTTAASGDKQKAIDYYNQAIQALQKQDDDMPKPVTQNTIDSIQTEISKLKGTN
jgi:hypothetical protein